MKKLLSIIALVAIAAASGYAAAHFSNQQGVAHKETAFERVMRTKTIRCGYGMWPPAVLTKDANTGTIGGFAAEVIEAIAKKNGLSVDWAEETGWSTYAEGLNSGRFDVFCSTAWIRAELASQLRYTQPLTFSTIHFYARADDHRFDADLNVLNDPAYSVAVMDGEISQRFPSQHFPKTRQVAIPQMADIMQLYLDVTAGKADGLFNDPSLGADYAAKNPGTLRRVSNEPLAVFANAYPVGFAEADLQSLLDTSLIELRNFGELDAIIEKYDPGRLAFLPVSKPYQPVALPPLP